MTTDLVTPEPVHITFGAPASEEAGRCGEESPFENNELQLDCVVMKVGTEKFYFYLKPRPVVFENGRILVLGATQFPGLLSSCLSRTFNQNRFQALIFSACSCHFQLLDTFS